VIFEPTPLAGAYLIELERHEDDRGFFARTFCQRELAEHQLEASFVQCNVSFNSRRGTLRGLHFQAPPHGEAKLVRCTRGSLFDVIVDLRPDSESLAQHFAVVLSAAEGNQLYIPEGFAHGFQTLEDDTEVFYQMSAFYVPEAARGYRFDDPTFAIAWPQPVTCISEKDRQLPFYP
jgi:dTDP-4-dehydrorhamnose 3,5-epimerase